MHAKNINQSPLVKEVFRLLGYCTVYSMFSCAVLIMMVVTCVYATISYCCCSVMLQ